MNNLGIIQESLLVDIKSGSDWKIGRIKSVQKDSAEVFFHESEDQPKIVRTENIFKFRTETNLKALIHFSSPFKPFKLEAIENILQYYLGSSNFGETDKIQQNLRGNLPIFIYGILKSDISVLLDHSQPILQIIFMVLNLSTKVLKQYSKHFSRGAGQADCDSINELLLCWPEVLDITEKILGKEDFFKQFYEIIKVPEEYDRNEERDGLSIIQIKLIDCFVSNGGIDEFLALLNKINLSPDLPHAFAVSIDLEFYDKVLSSCEKTKFFNNLTTNFLKFLIEAKESLFKADEILKLFKNALSVLKNSQEEQKEFTEDAYKKLILKCFYSNNLDKRIRSVVELSNFIENSSRLTKDSQLISIIEENSLIPAILEIRIHHQILRKSYPIIKFYTKHCGLNDCYFKMVQKLETSPERNISQCFPSLIQSIYEYLSPSQKTFFNQFEKKIIFFTEEDSKKIFNCDLFKKSFAAIKEFKQVNSTLDKISEHMLLEENLSLKNSFFPSFAAGLGDLKMSYMYLKLIFNLFLNMQTESLKKYYKELRIIRTVVKNLELYQADLYGQKENVVAWMPHDQLLLVRFHLIEHFSKTSKFLISKKNEEMLFEIVLKYKEDETLQKAYFYSTKSRLLKTKNTNPEVFLDFYSNAQPLFKMSFYFAKLFKTIFFEVNKGKNLKIENGKFVSVINREVKGLNILFQVLYNTERSGLKIIKPLIKNLLTCYSLEIVDIAYEVFYDSMQLLWCLKNDDNLENTSRFIEVINELLFGYQEANDRTVNIIVKFSESQEKLELPEISSVFYIRKSIASKRKTDVCEVAFKFNEALYGYQKNSKIIKLSENASIDYVPQSNILELSYTYLLKTIKEFKEDFWKYSVSNENFRFQAFQVAKQLGFSDGIREKIWDIKVTEGDFDLNQAQILIQMIIQTEFFFQHEEFILKAKESKNLVILLRGIIKILQDPRHLNFVIYYLLKIFEQCLKIMNVCAESLVKTYVEAVKWLYSNLFDPQFKKILDVFGAVSSLIFESYHEVTVKNIAVFIEGSLEDIIDSFTVINKGGKNIGNFPEYMRYFLCSSGCLDRFLDSAFQRLPEKIQRNEYCYLLELVNSIIVYLSKSNLQKAQNLASELFKLLFGVSETHSVENSNLFHIFRILQSHAKLLENINFDKLLSESLFSIPQKQDNALPRCKSNKTRRQAFLFVIELSKLHKGHLEKLLKYVSHFNKMKFWRTNKEKDWTISITSPKRPFMSYIAIKNPSSICYSNSLIQQLFHITPFREIILRFDPEPDYPLLIELQNIFIKLKYSNKSPISSKNLIRVFHGYPNYTEQMDADEYLARLFENLNNSYFAGKALDMFFSGTQIIEISSKDCAHSYPKEEGFYSLNINISTGSLKNGLVNFFKSELLQYENAYMCDKCRRKVNAVLKSSLKTLPNYFIFTLKRFEYDMESGNRTKLNSKFLFDEILDLQMFVSEKYADLSQTCLYRLKGITLHAGTCEQGHYFSCIKTAEDLWVEFNDKNIEQIKKEVMFKKAFGGKDDPNSPSAYILIYEREKAEFSSYYSNFKSEYLDSQEEKISNGKVMEKNEQIMIKEIIFSDNYLDFIDFLIDVNGAEKAVFEYFLACFIRTSLRDNYKMKIFKKIFNVFTVECCEFLLSVVSNLAGFKEFILWNSNIESKKLIMMFIKKFINQLPEHFLQLNLQRFMGIVNYLHSEKLDPPEILCELVCMFASLVPKFSKSSQVLTFVVESLISKYPRFKMSESSQDPEFVSKEYHKLALPKKLNSGILVHFLRYLGENLFNLTESSRKSIENESYLVTFLRSAKTKKDLISLNQYYLKVFKQSTEKSLNFLNILLEISIDYLDKSLKLMSLFVNSHPGKIELLILFLDNYLNFVSEENDESNLSRIKYAVKMIRGVKLSQIIGFIQQDIISRIQALLGFYNKYKGKCYESNKISRTFEVFFNDIEEEIWDSDDEIDQKYLTINKMIYARYSNQYEKCVVEDSLNGEIVLVKLESKNTTKMIDQYSFDSIIIPFHN